MALSLAQRLRHSTRKPAVGPCLFQDGRPAFNLMKGSQSSLGVSDTVLYSVFLLSPLYYSYYRDNIPDVISLSLIYRELNMLMLIVSMTLS